MKKLLPLLLFAGFAACTNDKMQLATPAPPACDTASVTYTNTIRPLTNQHCAISGCHTGADQAGGINLETYDGLKAIALNGDGDLLGTIRWQVGHSPMPQGAAKLDDCTISKYAKWVAAGAPNN